MSDPARARTALRRHLEDGIARGETPGAVAWVARRGDLLERLELGDRQVVPERRPMAADTVFDLGSLTKPLATAALVMILEEELGLGPERPARTILPELDTLDHAGVTLRHLLTHTAGFPAWRPLFLHADSVAGFLQRLREEPRVGWPGEKVVYSDPGYMAAGEMVARAAGAGLDELFHELLARPLGLEATFRPPAALADRAAATEAGQEYERRLAGKEAEGYDGFRTHVLRGEVYDHHAWVAGGVLGSAGLFGTARDVHLLALEVLGEGQDRIPARGRERMHTSWGPAGDDARTEGFAVNGEGKGSGGPALSHCAIGHTGFPGTSVWIDLETGGIDVLLTNRIHPRVRDSGITDLRRGFHAAAAALRDA